MDWRLLIMQIDLKFIKSWGSYNAGEIARFVGDQARVLIERGVALEHQAVAAVENLAGNLLPQGDAPKATQGTQTTSTGLNVGGPSGDGSTADQAKLNQKPKASSAAS
jgi:hypothetical protein